MTYHSLSGLEWKAITNACIKNGFEMVSFDWLVQKTFTPRQINRSKSIKGDVLVEITKKDGGVSKLGIPTILDRIAQEVVKAHLELITEPKIHDSSFGYRPGRSCVDAVDNALNNIMNHDWVIDLDIQSFFDTIDDNFMMKAVCHYCKDKWVLLYVSRWLKAVILSKEGIYMDSIKGTPQGVVISPLLANIFMHVVFDKWMEIEHHNIPFVRYADDIVVHCKTEKQAKYALAMIKKRLAVCRLAVHPVKTRIVNLRGITTNKYLRSFDFLDFTFKPYWAKTSKGFRKLITVFISQKSMSRVLDKFKKLELHKRRLSIEELAKILNPITRGVLIITVKCGQVTLFAYGTN